MITSELKNKDRAIDFLARELEKGSLGLFLGAGVSRSFDVGGWLDLLNEIRSHPEVNLDVKEKYEKDSSGNILKDADDKNIFREYSAANYQSFADEVYFKLNEDEQKLKTIVKEVLYKGVDFGKSFDFFKHRQLISLSMLITGGLRGKVDTVFTLNYDTLLEWYLTQFGIKSNSVKDLPYMKIQSDVEIFHPHGYLANDEFDKGGESKIIVLAKKQAARRLANRENPWFDTTLQHLNNKVFLFIGMSESTSGDILMATLLTRSHDLVKKTKGVWIFVNPIDSVTESSLLSVGIAPLILEKKDISKFLLDINKRASEL